MRWLFVHVWLALLVVVVALEIALAPASWLFAGLVGGWLLRSVLRM